MTVEDQCMIQATEQHAAHIQITPVQCMEEDQDSALSVPSNDSRDYRSVEMILTKPK